LNGRGLRDAPASDVLALLLSPGTNFDAWRDYDATELARKYPGPKTEIFVDQGTADSFLKEQLLPENLKNAVHGKDNIDLKLEYRDGYDHSYFYIASFVEEHILFHAKHLKPS